MGSAFTKWMFFLTVPLCRRLYRQINMGSRLPRRLLQPNDQSNQIIYDLHHAGELVMICAGRLVEGCGGTFSQVPWSHLDQARPAKSYLGPLADQPQLIAWVPRLGCGNCFEDKCSCKGQSVNRHRKSIVRCGCGFDQKSSPTARGAHFSARRGTLIPSWNHTSGCWGKKSWTKNWCH